MGLNVTVFGYALQKVMEIKKNGRRLYIGWLLQVLSINNYGIYKR